MLTFNDPSSFLMKCANETVTVELKNGENSPRDPRKPQPNLPPNIPILEIGERTVF